MEAEASEGAEGYIIQMRKNSLDLRVKVVTQILACRKLQKLSIWRLIQTLLPD